MEMYENFLTFIYSHRGPTEYLIKFIIIISIIFQLHSRRIIERLSVYDTDHDWLYGGHRSFVSDGMWIPVVRGMKDILGEYQ